jgi:hypothetical protein
MIMETAGALRPRLDGIREVVLEIVRTEARRWFPELAQPAPVTLEAHQQRPRCSLFRIRVGTGAVGRRVVAKARHTSASPCEVRAETRPLLAQPARLSASDIGEREFAGLDFMARAFSSLHDDRFGVVRPLGYYPEHAVLVMDYIEHRTLRQWLLSQSRLRPPIRRGPSLGTQPWRNAGAWLRAFHGSTPSFPTTLRH